MKRFTRMVWKQGCVNLQNQEFDTLPQLDRIWVKCILLGEMLALDSPQIFRDETGENVFPVAEAVSLESVCVQRVQGEPPPQSL